MDKLSAYKLDNAYTGGVELTLDNAPDVIFMVRLPSMYNRAYTQALYSGMHMEVNDDGTVTGDTNIMDAKYAQEDAFVAHCLVSIDGEPLSKSFADDYPAALAELMEKATALATSIEEKVTESVKKSPTTSHGKSGGRVETKSTMPLNSVAS